jgi:hypothetical protein
LARFKLHGGLTVTYSEIGNKNIPLSVSGQYKKQNTMKNRQNEKLKTLLTVIAVMTTLLSFGQEQQNKKPTVLPINEAIDKGLLELKISGASDPRIFHEVVDRDGVHFGKCMAIILKSNIDSLVLLKIDCGTELIPFDTTYQTMIVTKTVELPLYPNQTYATRFYAMCGQIHDDPPHIESTYIVGELSDSNTVKLVQYFEKNFIQNMIGQHALWAYTDEADFIELEKYGADSLTIALAQNILNDLSIKTTLNSEKQTEEVLPDNTITVSKYLIYGSGGLVLLLLTTTIYLLIRRRRNDEINT